MKIHFGHCPVEPTLELAILKARAQALREAEQAFHDGFFKHEAAAIIISKAYETEIEYETKKIAHARAELKRTP